MTKGDWYTSNMKEITEQMINLYQLDKLRYDFMGYTFDDYSELSFHHLIVSRRNWSSLGLEGKGYTLWNGAILVKKTSHDYLHLIETHDPEIFYALTSEMMDMNLKLSLDIENLKRIRELLLFYERTNPHNIKRDYIEKRIALTKTWHQTGVIFW